MNQIKTIIFDLGGVLIDWNPRYLYRKIFKTEDTVEYFVTNICTNHWNEQQDGGRTFAEATDILVNQYPEYEFEIRSYYNRWTEMLNGSIDETVEILKSLKDSEEYRLYALTNWSAESFPYALENFEFLHWFEGVLVSGVEKIKKPDPAIFHLIFERYDIDPITTVFIDDNKDNISTAKELGLHTVHFKSSDQCRKELIELGVLN